MNFVYTQNKENFVYCSEVVTINSNELLSLLERIISNENVHSKNEKSIIWYLEHKVNGNIVVSQTRILSLVELAKIEELNILTTIINNRIVFIIHKDEIGVYDKSGFKIDLKEYVTDDLIVYFEDYNSWLVNYENGKYKIIDSYIWKK